MRTSRTLRLGSGLIDHAWARPDSIALTVGAREISYDEAATTSLSWAGRILDATGGRARRVGVLGHRSPTSYLGVAAALSAGAAFVPLNPRFPVPRSRRMVEQADLDAVIVDRAGLPLLPELLRGLERPPVVLAPDADRDEVPDIGGGLRFGAADLLCAPLDAPPEVGPDDLAYLLFTSGSTGNPKGVPVTHGNARAFLDSAQARYGITPQDRLSQTFDQTFDLSVFDLFMAWEHGARVCAMDPIELLAPFGHLERNEVSVWFSVPSVAAVLRRRGALRPDSMPTLRWSLFCGEALPRETAELWQAAAPASVLENLYGPTELTIACTVHRWDPARSPAQCLHGTVPIGRPFPGLLPLVVDDDLAPVADGEAGELCLAGPQTTPGYWGDPELTARRYVRLRGRTYYRTGDIVRRQGAELVFLGRNDSQVQVGGHRVELGEIEAVLREAGAVEAVALFRPDDGTVHAVVSGAADEAKLAAVCAVRLPHYMVPGSLRSVPELPRNTNGKVDRAELERWLDREQVGV